MTDMLGDGRIWTLRNFWFAIAKITKSPSTPEKMRMEDFSGQICSWTVANDFKNRCLIYGNKDILDTHSITRFINGSRILFYSPPS